MQDRRLRAARSPGPNRPAGGWCSPEKMAGVQAWTAAGDLPEWREPRPPSEYTDDELERKYAVLLAAIRRLGEQAEQDWLRNKKEPLPAHLIWGPEDS